MIAVMLKFKLYLSINLWGWITIILDTHVRVFAANSDTSNSNSSSCSCWLEETTVSMCLRLSRLQIGSVLTMWYIKLFILSIKPGTLDDLLHICYTLFIIQLHRVSKFQVMIFFLSSSDLDDNKITSIKSDTFNNLKNLYEL